MFVLHFEKNGVHWRSREPVSAKRRRLICHFVLLEANIGSDRTEWTTSYSSPVDLVITIGTPSLHQSWHAARSQQVWIQSCGPRKSPVSTKACCQAARRPSVRPTACPQSSRSSHGMRTPTRTQIPSSSIPETISNIVRSSLRHPSFPGHGLVDRCLWALCLKDARTRESVHLPNIPVLRLCSRMCSEEKMTLTSRGNIKSTPRDNSGPAQNVMVTVSMHTCFRSHENGPPHFSFF